MDNMNEDGCMHNLFRSFVCVTLSMLVGLHVYAYVWGPHDFEDGFSEVKYVVMQLTRGLSEVNRKHEHLRSEMQRISAVLPAMADATGRAKDAIEPSLRRNNRQIVDVRDYDRQMADFALETAGAKVVDVGETIDHVISESSVSAALHTLSWWLSRGCASAREIIRPGALPGECWAFKGSKGEATIQLTGPVRISGISIEHIPAHISATREISSAPQLFQIQGFKLLYDPHPHVFGSFEYDKDGKPIQYFEVLYPSPNAYNFVKLQVLSNWGHPVYTCLYRFRVHGELDTGQGFKSTITDDELQIENDDANIH